MLVPNELNQIKEEINKKLKEKDKKASEFPNAGCGGCNSNCVGSCSNTCSGTCYADCVGSCSNTCTSCVGSCYCTNISTARSYNKNSEEEYNIIGENITNKPILNGVPYDEEESKKGLINKLSKFISKHN